MDEDLLFKDFEKFWKTPTIIKKYDPITKYTPASMAMFRRKDAAFMSYQEGFDSGQRVVRNDLSWALSILQNSGAHATDPERFKLFKEIKRRNGL